MNRMTKDEYEELRNATIDFVHDLLGGIDYHYLRNHSRIYALCSVESEIESHLLNLKRQIGEYSSACN